MKPGDLVTTKHGCLALYVQYDPIDQRGVVEHGEIMMVLGYKLRTRWDSNLRRVATTDGRVGWVNSFGLEKIK